VGWFHHQRIVWRFVVHGECHASGDQLGLPVEDVLRALGRDRDVDVVAEPQQRSAFAQGDNPAAVDTPDAATTGYTVTQAARASAGVALGVWFAAIVFGRIIAYVMDHAMLHGGA